MRIAEAAKISGLSIDTIRFYEKSGMLPPLARDARGWRRFDKGALEWLTILGHLRKTGMPLDEVRQFALSVHSTGAESTAAQNDRLTLLQTHAARLAKQRAELDACAAYLDHKIAIYSGLKETQDENT